MVGGHAGSVVVTYACAEPRCRWALFNGPHPDLVHAVWWRCTKRPAKPFAAGDMVSRTYARGSAPVPVDHCSWDIGLGWRVYLRHGDGPWAVGGPERPEDLRPAVTS